MANRGGYTDSAVSRRRLKRHIRGVYGLSADYPSPFPATETEPGPSVAFAPQVAGPPRGSNLRKTLPNRRDAMGGGHLPVGPRRASP